jgi:hypothetical protein
MTVVEIESKQLCIEREKTLEGINDLTEMISCVAPSNSMAQSPFIRGRAPPSPKGMGLAQMPSHCDGGMEGMCLGRRH